MHVTIHEIPGQEITITAPEFDIQNYSLSKTNDEAPHKGIRFVKAIIDRMYQLYRLEKGLHIHTSNGFSSKYGLGSSSAVSVCTAKAISEFHNLKLSQKELFDVAYSAVLDVQGLGSGFDVAAAIWGGTLYFVTGGKKIDILSNTSLPIVITYSGTKADTPTIVKALAKKRQKNIPKFDNYFDQITQIVRSSKSILKTQNWPEAGRLASANQRILQKLGVSTQKLDHLCRVATKHGAFGAKLTGAGGGDCMISFVGEEHQERIKEALTEAGGDIIPVSTGAEGVRIELN
jgi:mevalonate kinase